MDLVIDDAASRAAGKAKKPKELPVGGGLGHAGGPGGGFKALDFNKLTGAERRSRKSKARDKSKKQHGAQKGEGAGRRRMAIAAARVLRRPANASPAPLPRARACAIGNTVSFPNSSSSLHSATSRTRPSFPTANGT